MIVKYLLYLKDTSIYIECLTSVIAFIMLLAFSRTSWSYAVDINVLSLSLTFSEGLAFITIVLLNIEVFDQFFLTPAVVLITGYCISHWKLNVILFTPENRLSAVAFFVINFLLFICRIAASLNFRNPPHIDMIQKSGAALSLAFVFITTVLDSYPHRLPFFNFAGGITDYTVHYIILPNIIKFKVTMVYNKENITVTASRKLDANNGETERRAEEALTSIALIKGANLNVFKNILKQSIIDRHLTTFSTHQDEYFKAIVTCLSIGCLKAAAKFNRQSTAEYIRNQNVIFGDSTNPLYLEYIMLESAECNFETTFKDISVVIETQSLQSSVQFASRLRCEIKKKMNEIFVCRKSKHKEVLSECYKCVDDLQQNNVEEFNRFKIILNMKQSCQISYTTFQTYKKHIHGLVNPYAETSNDWGRESGHVDLIATSSNEMTRQRSKMTSIANAVTVTNILLLAQEAKIAGQKFIVAEDTFETSDSITVDVALGVRAHRIRLQYYEDTTSMIVEHLIMETNF